MNKVLAMFLVMVRQQDGSLFPYYEVAYNAKEAVAKVKCYIADEEQIDSVYKEVKW